MGGRACKDSQSGSPLFSSDRRRAPLAASSDAPYLSEDARPENTVRVRGRTAPRINDAPLPTPSVRPRRLSADGWEELENGGSACAASTTLWERPKSKASDWLFCGDPQFAGWSSTDGKGIKTREPGEWGPSVFLENPDQ